MLLTNAAVTPAAAAETRTLVLSLREKDEDRAGYHLALGALALRQRDEAGAQAEFEAAAKLDPNLPQVHAALAALAWSRKDIKTADEAFKTAVGLSPLRSTVRVRYADFKLRTGAPSEAKAILEEITAKQPDYLPARVFSMKIACTEHRDEDCARQVRNVLAQDPTNYEALFQDGLLSFDKEDAANAVRAFEFLSNIYRRNPLVRYQLAVALLREAKDQNPANGRTATDAAESRLSEAIDLDPHFELAVLLFAQLKIPRGGAAAAVRALQQVLRDRPQSAEANYLLASAYLAQQQRQAALRVYRRMTEFLPKAPQPWFLMARVLTDEKEPAEARRALEKSVEIDPDYLPATERLADLDIADKQYSTALDRVQKLIDKDAKSAPAWALRGKIHVAERDFGSAEPDLLKAIDLEPQLGPA